MAPDQLDPSFGLLLSKSVLEDYPASPLVSACSVAIGDRLTKAAAFKDDPWVCGLRF
jgi:hypothetical protein